MNNNLKRRIEAIEKRQTPELEHSKQLLVEYIRAGHLTRDEIAQELGESLADELMSMARQPGTGGHGAAPGESAWRRELLELLEAGTLTWAQIEPELGPVASDMRQYITDRAQEAPRAFLQIQE